MTEPYEGWEAHDLVPVIRDLTRRLAEAERLLNDTITPFPSGRSGLIVSSSLAKRIRTFLQPANNASHTLQTPKGRGERSLTDATGQEPA